MAAPANASSAVPQDTLITIKVSVNDSLKKLKLPLKDLGANVLPDKLRLLLAIQPHQTAVFERFSDSAGGYVTLDPNNPQVFKTLIRAAKAKLKLRLKATVSPLLAPSPAEAIEMPEEKTKHKSMEPVITRSPTSSQTSPRESTAIDGRSLGSGIFQFREARATQQPLVDVSEAPLPLPFDQCAPRRFTPTLVATPTYPHASRAIPLPLRCRESVAAPVAAPVTRNGRPFSVHCNECDAAMADAHFHCNICDKGDYDLCEDCVAGGKLCPGEGHWLIKRNVQDGIVISSTTERISPRSNISKPDPEVRKEIPGAFAEETKTLAESLAPTRTCNSCIIVLPECEFVTCKACEDFDLCVKCHSDNQHGHHPSHAFQPAIEGTILPKASEMLLGAGRNTRHNAICDGCDKKIFGVRHKCLNCPDWDYCGECYKSAKMSHPHHRFAPLYESIPEPRTLVVRHDGIFCDGPMCKGQARQSYIHGVRYKCAVCHDTDFCASCEALPHNLHNRTHPLIKFKTAVRNVSITTENEDLNGQMRSMGDRRPMAPPIVTRTASTETTPILQANAATQVQTVAEIKPTEIKVLPKPIPVVKPTLVRGAVPPPAAHPSTLQAHFVQDSVVDGTVLEPGARFTQMWTMRNPGPFTWPTGCSVRFVGGDNMLNLDNNHPAAVSDVNDASESNVLGRDVPMGEEVAFKITLKAPAREGKHISYWRMKTAEGMPFGHRLWCDIEVKKAQVAITPPAPAPARAAPIPITVTSAGPSSPQAQALRERRSQIIKTHQQLQQQQQMAMAHQQYQMQQQRAAMQVAAATRQTLAHNNSGPPPPYSDAANNIPARIAFMREQQAKRREHMMQQANAQVEQAQSSATLQKSAIFEEQQITEDRARKDAARQRVEHIKAKILRAREEQAKTVEAERERIAANAVATYEQKKQVEGQKMQKIIDTVKEDKKEDKVEDVEGSQMVFPKLDKESPASSTYESLPSSSSSKAKAAYVENEQGEVERSSVASPTPVVLEMASPTSEEDRFDLDEDIEVLSAHDGEESDDDDAFLTDEEYDILDASDQETVKSI